LRGKKQFTEEECEETLLIARARVHVERAIQRIKNFGVFKGNINSHLLGLLDHIMIVACALVNLEASILADDKF
jgi:hypothetical protein